PILVGTVSIEKSEELSAILKRKGIKHTVLNAKYHEQEAEIIAQAGKPGAVTIATNMAGRGTDIKLGGNDEQMAIAQLKKEGITDELLVEATGYADTEDAEILAARARYQELLKQFGVEVAKDAEAVRAAGGLFILGTERHESRRIDNQLRGRAGRQGDPGESSFYISMEDDLMRLFGSEKLQGMMDSLGIAEDEPIDQKILSGAIESAQKKIESRNFGIRKNVLEYDDVMNTQRGIIYGQRLQVLRGEDISGSIRDMIDSTIVGAVQAASGEHKELTEEMMRQACEKFVGVFISKSEIQYAPGMTPEALTETLKERAHRVYEMKEAAFGSDTMRELERVVLLRNVDTKWMDHIDAMSELRNGIGLRAYGQHDPVIEYKREGFDMFDAMVDSIREDTVRMIFLVQLRSKEEPKREKVAKETGASGSDDGTLKKEPVRVGKKVGRNDPCPCGSGLKYKKCCGKNQ
ncbi:MAG: SEC-C domain-containing protein, partial [Butyricicoccus sp.]|nr:SEC-C domain-containing protein [Butyricicoccus sp.]